jgi:YgiT-type zinc finger domain-containing protein
MTATSQPAETFHCPLCGGATFRRSRLTWQDLSHLLLLEIPIRCQECGERASVVLPKAIHAVNASAKRKSKLQY